MKVVGQILGMGGIGGEGRSDYRSDNAWFGEYHGGVYNAVSQLKAKGGG
jgi:hypothetical protein